MRVLGHIRAAGLNANSLSDRKFWVLKAFGSFRDDEDLLFLAIETTAHI